MVHMKCDQPHSASLQFVGPPSATPSRIGGTYRSYLGYICAAQSIISTGIHVPNAAHVMILWQVPSAAFVSGLLPGSATPVALLFSFPVCCLVACAQQQAYQEPLSFVRVPWNAEECFVGTSQIRQAFTGATVVSVPSLSKPSSYLAPVG